MENISALMDGELDADDAALVIGQFSGTDELRERWATYHLISDALGQSEVRPSDITRRVNARLATEPAISAAVAFHTAPKAPKRRPITYAAAASIAAAVVGGWMILQTTQGTDPAKQNLADNKPAAIPATPPAPVTAYPAIPAAASLAASAPAQINDYLLAHRQFSPSTAMHGVTPYMRTAAESQENFRR